MKLKFKGYFYQIAVFSAVVLVLLMLARVSNILMFGNWQDIGQYSAFLSKLFFKGFRFDLKLLATLLIVFVWLPALLISWAMPLKWFSSYIQRVFKILLILLVFIIFVDIGFIYYFQKTIDVLIFGFLQDDTSAILSIILSNYKLMLLFAGFVVFTAGVVRLYSKLSAAADYRTGRGAGQKLQLMLWILSFIMLLVLARGSLDTFPLQRKHASVSSNTFLNSMVMNSGFNLHYAFADRRENSQAIFKQNILTLNHLDSLDQLKHKAGYDDQHPLIRTTAVNNKLEQIKPHVIFVLMESWSSQIALAQSANNDVLGEFAKHANQDHFYTRFFTHEYATNPSIEALLINSPITPLSQSIANKTTLNLSNVLPYKKQNYKTLFLSGGYSSWRNHNNFWLLQGFDRYIGRSEIENHFQVDASDNPWGVYDEYVFEYLKKSLLEAEQNAQSLFSFVLTTNNHPPIRLPKSYVRPPLSPALYGFDNNDKEKIALLAGFNYQTTQLGRFISWIKDSEFKDRVIIVATGDHPQRTFIDNSANEDKYLRYSVPAYFYVPDALDRLNGISMKNAASHSDLFPTLFELSLSNAGYYNFGQPLMEKNREEAYGWSAQGEFLFADGVVDSRNNKFYPWRDDQHRLLQAEPGPVSKDHQAVIDQEYYRRLLKQYLIVSDYQQK